MKKQNESGNLRHKIVYSKELTALEKRYLLELMMTKQTEGRNQHESTQQKNGAGKGKNQS